MAKLLERSVGTPTSVGTSPPETPYPLRYLDVTYSFGDDPKTALQREITDQLTRCLNSEEFRGIEYPLPTRKTPPDQTPLVYIVYGDGALGSDTRFLKIRGKLPKFIPPMSFMINTADHLPIQDDLPAAVNRLNARKELVEGTSHCGAIFRSPEEVLWVSTQGNCGRITGDPRQVMRAVVQRIQAHYCSPTETRRHNEGGLILPWRVLTEHPFYEKLAERAHKLGATYVLEGNRYLIEDCVNLREYTPNVLKAYKISHAMNETDEGVGESAAFEAGPEGTLGCTQTGGRKVNIDADPRNFTPIWAITEDGYMIPDVEGKPLFFDFKNVSREGHEGALLKLGNSWARDKRNIKDNGIPAWQQFLQWVQEQFAKGPFIAIHQPDFPPSSVVSIEHNHWHAKRVREGYNIRITAPDLNYFPPWDYGCGLRHSAWSTVSAVMQVKEFLQPEGLGNTVILANLPGHGMIGVAEDRDTMNDAVVNGVELATPALV